MPGKKEDVGQTDGLDPESQTEDSVEGSEGGEEIVHSNGEMGNRLSALERNQQILGVLADPDVQAVLKAKQSGKKLKLVEDDQGDPEETPEPQDDGLSDLPEDDPVRKTLERVDKLVNARLGKVVKTLDQRLVGVESLATEVQRKDVVSQVETAKKKYKDLDQYKDAMVELNRSMPGLGVEDLYILAKHRSGKLRLAEQATFSEKPTNQPQRRPGGKVEERQKQRAPGKKGFSQLLGEALNKLNLDEN